MNKFCIKITQLCPVISLLFSLLTVTVTTVINGNQISPIFAYFCTQVYLNWFLINRTSHKATTIGILNGNDEQSKSRGNNHIQIQIQIQSNNNRSVPVFCGQESNDRLASYSINDKFWYCERCTMYTRRPLQHCPICEKCFHHRDHHCFLIGGCILRQNMGNFILICVYTSLSSIYSLIILAPYLYKHLDHFLNDESTGFEILLNFSFPLALARFLFSAQESCIILITLFDALLSISCICLGYGLWKFYACLTGQQRYFPYGIKKDDITEVFGSYGLWNFVFPINGVLGAKLLPQQSHAWKEI